MKLLLTSSGITNKSIAKALSELVEKPFEELNLTFIPTAATIEKEDKKWLVEDMYNAKRLGFKNFFITDISAVSRDIWLPQIKAADVLLFGGGDTNYLVTWLRKSGLDKLLPDLLKTKVYVGISAGSMATAKTVSLSSAGILYYEQTGKFEDTKGLGFVDFEIRPHLNSVWFPKVRIDFLNKLAKDTPNTFYAIDDNTALKVVDKKVEIISEGEWKKFN